MEAQGEGGRWSRLDARLRSLSPRRRVLIILSIFVAVYGSFIAMDGLLFRPFIDQSFANSSDLSIFQERAKLLLNGGMIYRDVPYGSFPVESPPLINYLFIPPQLAGGEWWAYEIWFSLFALLSSLSAYLILRAWDEHLAQPLANHGMVVGDQDACAHSSPNPASAASRRPPVPRLWPWRAGPERERTDQG